MLVNRSEYGIQAQPRTDWDRPVAAPADPSYLTWQGVPHWLGKCQIIYHIILVSILQILQSHWIMGNQDGSPTVRDYEDTLVVSLSSLVDDTLSPKQGLPGFPWVGLLSPPGPPGDSLPIPLASKVEVPWLPRWRSPWSIWSPRWRSPDGDPPGSSGSPSGGPPHPPGGGSACHPGGSGPQGPPRQSCM